MKEKLIQQLKHSYSPYSHFRVAAIAVMKDGKEFLGSNVENASFGATICAERVAITSAIASGYTKGDFAHIYIMCDNKKIGMPCFMCRQVFIEFLDASTSITVMNPEGESSTFSLLELCPYPFSEDDLK